MVFMLYVGTPSCVYDMLQSRSLLLNSIKMFVVDEADALLSGEFEEVFLNFFISIIYMVINSCMLLCLLWLLITYYLSEFFS